MGRRKTTSDPPPAPQWTAVAPDQPQPAPVAPDDADPVVDALPAAETNGHKVGRSRNELFCWHCDATGIVTSRGRQGPIFTERCRK